MANFFLFKIITIVLMGSLLSSCNSKKANFEIDLADFKVPTKSSTKISNSKVTKPTRIKNKLVNYQNKEEVFSSVLLGKKDPFSEEKIEANNLTSDLKLTGFLNTGIYKYVFVSYLGEEGTITEASIGGINTSLLPNGAKVINIDTQKLQLIINLENKDYTLDLYNL